MTDIVWKKDQVRYEKQKKRKTESNINRSKSPNCGLLFKT